MECYIRKHDNRQFEVKVTYPLERSHPREKYHLKMFLFLPYQIGVDRATYPPKQFYDDLRSYTRFKTPNIALRDMLKPELDVSPFTRIVRFIEEGKRAGTWNESRLNYELKTLAVVVNVQLRDRLGHIRS